MRRAIEALEPRSRFLIARAAILHGKVREWLRRRGSVLLANMASTEQVGLNKTWELSLYELHRTPQDAITDNTEIAVSPRSLHSELMCPICLDMLKKTMTTKECLHRFCSDCIITALRSGNKVPRGSLRGTGTIEGRHRVADLRF
jgi:hypothetical protein